MTKAKRVPYHHITKEERFKIESYLEDNIGVREIARRLSRSPSTISTEIRQGRKRRPATYAARAVDRHVRKRKSSANTRFTRIPRGSVLETQIVSKLKLYWSPEQIAGRLQLENHGKTIVCHQTIYDYIYTSHPELKKYLRCRKGKWRRKRGTKQREKQREEGKKKRIDARPAIVETRKRLGDWEGDTIVGKEKTVHILTHAERKSRFLLADKVSHATAKEVRLRTMKRFQRLPQYKRQTLTYDNGIQFAEHEQLERDLKTSIYFAYPYHSWERGTNENTNGLLRQFFPKGSAFTPITQQRLDRIVKLINTRPRKCLAYQTPEEVFKGCSASR